MTSLVLEAYFLLIRTDRRLQRGDFHRLYDAVKNRPSRARSARTDAVKMGCLAMDLACIWYWRQASCLVRSAATVCLLRNHGVLASLVIGAQQMPFRAHAWVEVDGQVVNDKPYIRDIYAVLDCF